MTATRYPEVLVLGGGPAGSTAAGLLAAWGHDVTLLSRPAPPAATLAQSIPPSARKLLAEVGALEAVAGAGFHRNGGNTVWWAERPVRSETFAPDELGWHVERAGLEAVLNARAEASGARLQVGQAHAVAWADGGWRVRTAGDAGGDTVELGASWLLDATGRAGVVARTGLRRPDERAPTLALVRRWGRTDGWADVPAEHTLIESHAGGWAWSVPVSGTERCVTAMVDPELTDLGARTDLGEAYAAELAGCEHLARFLASASPLGDVWACPASLYGASPYARPGLLLVGDAGSFIDPLSSYGVKKALASAWLAAVVVHTALADPAMAEAAIELYDANESLVYRTYRGRSVEFFSRAAETYGHPYWERRAEAARAAAGSVTGREDPADRRPGDRAEADLPSEDAVRAAYEQTRAEESFSARAGATLRSLPRPGVEGNRVVMVPHLATDRAPGGLRWARNVDLVVLVEEAPRHDGVPDLYEAYCGRCDAVPIPDFLAALAVAFAGGLLERADAG